MVLEKAQIRREAPEFVVMVGAFLLLKQGSDVCKRILYTAQLEMKKCRRPVHKV